jgi:hypothetical protein
MNDISKILRELRLMGERLSNWRFFLIWVVFCMFGVTSLMFGLAKLLSSV